MEDDEGWDPPWIIFQRIYSEIQSFFWKITIKKSQYFNCFFTFDKYLPIAINPNQQFEMRKLYEEASLTIVGSKIWLRSPVCLQLQTCNILTVSRKLLFLKISHVTEVSSLCANHTLLKAFFFQLHHIPHKRQLLFLQSMSTLPVLGLHGLFFGCTGWLQGWLLCKAARSFFHVYQSQSLVAPKMDVPLAKAGPIRNDGNAHGITFKRKKQRWFPSFICGQRRAEWKHMWGTMM